MFDQVRETSLRTISEARAGHRRFAEIVQDPEARMRWLRGSRAAHVAFGVTVVGGLFVFPFLRDALVDLVFPSTSQSGGFLGLSSKRVANPLAEPVSWFLTFIFWSAGLGVTWALLWREIPSVLDGSLPTEPPPPLMNDAATMQTQVPAGATELGTSMERRTPARAAPSSLSSRYAISKQLGEGGMGQVFLAEDTTLGRQVALKKLPSELVEQESIRERFRREARALAQLNHPNVVQVFDFVEEEEGMWIVLEVVSGGDLETKMETEPLPLREICRLGCEMAAALQAAHACGIVHRDFKPANVMLTDRNVAKVTDFGIAKLENASAQADTKLTQAGTIMGTPTYMSPEQARGTEVGPPSDVYSLGATLYEMLTGAPIFEGTLTQVVAAHIVETPRSFLEVSAALDRPVAGGAGRLEELVFAMLEKDPLARPSLDDVLEVLSRELS